MSSASAKWRTKLKEDDPEKYAGYLNKEKERSKRRRDQKKLEWQTEPHTRAAIQKHELAKEHARERQHRFMEKKKLAETTRRTRRGRQSQLVTQSDRPQKNPKDMTPDEYREHRRLLREKSRAVETPQKKRRAREKNTNARRLKRQAQKVRYMASGEFGSGAGKGGGSGGAVRDAGGAFGKMEAAHEELYFKKLEREQMAKLRKHLEEEVDYHKDQIGEHKEAIERHKKKIQKLHHQEKDITERD